MYFRNLDSIRTIVTLALSLFILVGGAPSLAFADEVFRPQSHSDLSDPTFELAREVIGAEVAWVNRAAIDRDFP